jgi:hypothetical protein
VAKTGIFVEIFDTYSERTIYTGNWYSNKDHYNKGEDYHRSVTWLFPLAIPSSVYEVTVSIKDWINPDLPEYAKFTFLMDIKDIQQLTY